MKKLLEISRTRPPIEKVSMKSLQNTAAAQKGTKITVNVNGIFAINIPLKYDIPSHKVIMNDLKVKTSRNKD